MLFPAGAVLGDTSEAATSPETQSEQACTSETGGQNSSLQLVLLETRGNERVEPSCNGQRLESLTINLPPLADVRIDLGLVYPGDPNSSFSITTVAPQADEPVWLSVEPERGLTRQKGVTPITLFARADSSLAPSARHPLKLELTVVNGENRSSVTHLWLTLVVQEDQPLFRDRFEVDPVLGQFSYRAPEPARHRRPIYTSASSGTSE